MAVNPMQKKSRISFILGMLLMLLICGVIIVLLYMKLGEKDKKLQEYTASLKSVYVLNTDVKSGQLLTADMFVKKEISGSVVPSDATSNIIATLQSYALYTDSGLVINSKKGVVRNQTTNKDEEAITGYYVNADGKEREIKSISTGKAATSISNGEEMYYELDNNERVQFKVSESALVAKTDIKLNTIITGSMLRKSDEKLTDDLRKTEYNVITLPIDLITGEYVDIRLQLPNGQDYIVASKKQVTIPVANGMYLTDTIQMNLDEKEILYMSCAIVDNFQVKGSKLYAVKYSEAGMQEKAKVTYVPSNDVQNQIKEDSNILENSIEGLLNRRNDIERQIMQNSYGDSDGISSGIDKSTAASLEARKSYLETLAVPVN